MAAAGALSPKKTAPAREGGGRSWQLQFVTRNDGRLTLLRRRSCRYFWRCLFRLRTEVAVVVARTFQGQVYTHINTIGSIKIGTIHLACH